MKRLPKEDRAGLYITVIVHLAVIIVLLATQLRFVIQKEQSFLMDFSRIDAIEQLEKEIAFKEAINEKLEEMIAAAGNDPIRNVTVDKGALKDDRNTNAKELYEDAERLKKDLDGGFKAEEEVVAIEDKKAPENKDKKENRKSYSGPSVLSWELKGRKASRLPIPAYKCMGAGEVKVLIGVSNSGDVVSTSIDDAESSTDNCLRSYAIRAARMSRFSSDPKAPARQMGYITYKFIAQ